VGKHAHRILAQVIVAADHHCDTAQVGVAGQRRRLADVERLLEALDEVGDPVCGRPAGGCAASAPAGPMRSVGMLAIRLRMPLSTVRPTLPKLAGTRAVGGAGSGSRPGRTCVLMRAAMPARLSQPRRVSMPRQALPSLHGPEPGVRSGCHAGSAGRHAPRKAADWPCAAAEGNCLEGKRCCC
jgi:hypothetical protein